MAHVKLERIDYFIAKLRAIPKKDRDRIWGLCLAEIRHLKTGKWFPPGAVEPQYGYKTTSLRSVLTDYRNAVREQLGKTHMALKFLKPSLADTDAVNTGYAKTIVKRHTKLRPIDADDIVARAETIMQHGSRFGPFALAAAIIAVTGRRPWEIANGNLERIRRRGRVPRFHALTEGKTLKFSGQAKRVKRGYHAPPAPPYEIPVLTDPSLVLESFTLLHTLYPFRRIKDDTAFNRSAGKRIAEAAARFFSDAKRIPLTAKDLRHAYATITYAWYCPEDVSMNVYQGHILGHDKEDVRTSLSYYSMYLLGQRDAFTHDFRLAAQETMEKLERKKRRAPDPTRKEQIQHRIDLFRSALPK
jgi:integrase